MRRIRAALAGARRALRRLGLWRLGHGAVLVRLRAVAPGRLLVAVRWGSRTLAWAQRAVAPGRLASVPLRLSGRGLALLHRAHRARLLLSLVLVDASGHRTARSATASLRR